MSGDGGVQIEVGKRQLTFVLNWWKLALLLVPIVLATHSAFWFYSDVRNDARYAQKSEVVTSKDLVELKREANERFVTNLQFTNYQSSMKESLTDMKSDIADTRGDVKEILRYMRINK